ncbi:acetyl-coenzyme-A dehydrogenase [Scheffersomyces stipitis CBS 6054]|uniref:Acetyl-coenzyme-A dehydrogenase n=1 Tax=Scheffersomyces stipitis (strain ATCC 58785 / CBS 6054 / NBRC 10063 / NRRL Y-11545) TaxID=322104 RepID=A3LYA4_PICST|nr:acetyl-coenzyme-A dehydrogenase [Scheffersomyces stipitis CBS 6054]ABN67599.2 acetyl-coenzyme-A dehydrogenase [Scheffersomyces stipitis CBS 6054]
MSAKDDIPAIFLDKISPRGLEAIEKTKRFVEDYCLPADDIYFKQIKTDPAVRWKYTPEITEKLKKKAKELGLWNMFLSKHYKEGPQFTNLEYGLMAEYLGKSFVAPEATNTAAPDTGNMELFAKYGTPYQKEKWLKPLLNGEIRSAFLMTEKGVSSSNALNISTSAIKNAQGNYVLNGVKWFASGAGDPRCSVWLVMCKTTDDSSKPYFNHSVLILDPKVAIASGKARVVRPLHVIGYDDAPHGHCEIEFTNYEVSAEEMKNTILAGVGRGFELIQSRLGPGRIHHCMRSIGSGEFALLKTAHRANNRIIFGKPLANRESFITAFAQHKIDIQKCRLLVLNAAHKIDITNAKGAQKEIAMAKIETPRTVCKIIDWGMQMFGAEGLSQDTELARIYAMTRILRIADGPDEAHLNQLGRNEAKKFNEADAFFATYEASRARLEKL